jgi:hypothetical protein
MVNLEDNEVNMTTKFFLPSLQVSLLGNKGAEIMIKKKIIKNKNIIDSDEAIFDF